jgi:hypothetical protein
MRTSFHFGFTGHQVEQLTRIVPLVFELSSVMLAIINFSPTTQINLGLLIEFQLLLLLEVHEA